MIRFTTPELLHIADMLRLANSALHDAIEQNERTWTNSGLAQRCRELMSVSADLEDRIERRTL